MTKDWLSVEEVSNKLGITKNTVREKLITKEIKGTKVGREWRVLPQEINSILGIDTNEEVFKKEIYIKELEKENEILKNRINSFKSVLGSLNNIICI